MLYSWQLDRKQSLEKLKECYGVIESEENGKKVSEVPNKYFIMHFKDINLSTPENERFVFMHFVIKLLLKVKLNYFKYIRHEKYI